MTIVRFKVWLFLKRCFIFWKLCSENLLLDRFTAPFHGFKDAEDYYRKSGSLQYLEKVKSPVLMISAVDDPFLTEECFPFDIARRNRFIHLEVTSGGGHMGFVSFNRSGEYWHELRTLQFIREIAG